MSYVVAVCRRGVSDSKSRHFFWHLAARFFQLFNANYRWYYETNQSQKTQGFCVADFAMLSDERMSRSKIFLLFIWIKEPCVRKFEGLARSKLLGISLTIIQLIEI